MKNPFDFTGKVAIVTGAGSGIGRSAAQAFAECGAKVAALDVNPDGIAALAQEAGALGQCVLPVVCDIRSEEQVNGAVAKVMEAFGGVDILINNAGVSIGIMPEDPLDVFDISYEINLRGQWMMMRAVLPHMVEKGYGKIVNISSRNANVAFKNLPLHPYCATKAGVLGLTRSVAAFYAKYNINCNAICPGLFLTAMTETTWSQAQKDEHNQRTPAGRPGREGEMNGAILFLSSDAAAYINGATLAVDGGKSIA